MSYTKDTHIPYPDQIAQLKEIKSDLLEACKSFSNISYDTEDSNYNEVSKALELAQQAISKAEEIV